ncbi:hypothetical protein [Sorangium sp. So ce233]|uniref:hypothetical protein n=1 Tax=Sorangium sp. So ce233 TaxID=3133290 RepID=UPI003F633048
MASMVGKYVREALMARVARRYQRAVPGLRGASGYHDPVTSAFLGATRLVRPAREIPAACFERRAAEGDASLANGSRNAEAGATQGGANRARRAKPAAPRGAARRRRGRCATLDRPGG